MQPKKNEFSVSEPFAAGVIGALVGAGIGVIVAVALKDEKNREKLNDVLDYVNKKAGDYLKNAKAKRTGYRSPVSKKKITKLKESVRRLEAP